MAYISIHAPAEGATSLHIVQCDVINISIHAPAEGATLYDSFRSILYRFQSTLPRRERLRCTGEQEGEKEISIHAPAEGATQFVRTVGLPPCLISIHAPAGERQKSRCRFSPAHLFQSTLPRRERPRCWFAKMEQHNFNPRSRGGSDTDPGTDRTGKSISIHAPAEGATDAIRRCSA